MVNVYNPEVFLKRLLLLPIVFLFITCGGNTQRGQSSLALDLKKQPNKRVSWWNDRTFYEIFVRSFYDSDGDGIGDFRGIAEKLDYLNDGNPETTEDLGIGAIWLMPVMESSSYHGYDVTDYYALEEDYGTEEDFRFLLEEAHKRGIKVIVDMVFNHSSNQHPWFLSARMGPDAEFRDWYRWEEDNPNTRGPWGQTLWHRAGGDFFYGLFWEGMPDLNYENPEVAKEMLEVTRFWLEEMGVDGFRLDAVMYLYEEEGRLKHTDPTHQWLKEFHRLSRELNPESFSVAEIWDDDLEELGRYGSDEVDSLFHFPLSSALMNAVKSGKASSLKKMLKSMEEQPLPWRYATFLTNHDQDRVASQLYGNDEKAALAAGLLLTLPGTPFLYYGEEIGMTGRKPDEPIRRPMHWDSSAFAGFTSGERPWQPLEPDWEERNAAQMSGSPESLLNRYRVYLHLRNTEEALRRGALQVVDSDNPKVLAYLRFTEEDVLLILASFSRERLEKYHLDLSGFSFPEGDLLWENLADEEFPGVFVSSSYSFYRPFPLEPRSIRVLKLVGED